MDLKFDLVEVTNGEHMHKAFGISDERCKEIDIDAFIAQESTYGGIAKLIEYVSGIVKSPSELAYVCFYIGHVFENADKD